MHPERGAITVPHFTDSFTFNGVSYPYEMVGTNPKSDGSTTVVPSEIVPLKFVFSNGKSLSGASVLSQTLASPIFQSAKFLSGTTQYGDAIQRAMFWNFTANSDYHTLLGAPTVLPEITIPVPANQGVYLEAGEPLGPHIHTVAPTGVVEVQWFAHIYEKTMSDRVMLSLKPFPSGCCGEGFHSIASARSGNGRQKVRTGIFAAYGDPALFAVDPFGEAFGENVSILSHEVAEWLSDPFGTNIVPSWSSPLAPQYGCAPLLETGDPLLGVDFQSNGYSLQDEAFLSWFAHQSPSIGIKGRYTYLGTFPSASTLC